MWFEERSWGSAHLHERKMSSSPSLLLVEEWRDLWPHKAELMFAALAYVFATTNLLNVPRLMLENGGLAYVAAYGGALAAVVLPVVVLELAAGQLTGRAPVQALYNLCPVFQGVGVAQIAFSLCFMAYTARFLGWLLLFAGHLLHGLAEDRPGLPWLSCHGYPEFLQTAGPGLGDSCREPSLVEGAQLANATAPALSTFHAESALQLFMRALEQPSDSVALIGHFQPQLLAAQGAVWLLVFVGICFGVRWLGKVMAFTFLVPLSLLLTVCGRCLFLGGALEMFETFCAATDWQKLYDYMVWKSAAEQALLASGVGFGAFITIGSYNQRSNNLVKDAFLILTGHALLTALQAATVIALVGYVHVRTGLAPLELLEQGEKQMWQLLVLLSFLPHAKVFTAIVLFIAIFVLLNIFFLLSLSVLATLEDGLGERASRCLPRFFLALLVVLVGAGLGLYFTTQAGKHAYELTSGYLKYVTLFAILACELLAVGWFYCAHTLGRDVRSMLRDSACCGSWCMGHFLLLFTYLLPAVPVAIAVVNVWSYSYAVYSDEVRRWEWSECVGFALALVPLLPIPVFALTAICGSCRSHEGRSKCQRFRYAFRSPLRFESALRHSEDAQKSRDQQVAHSPRYTTSAPGYVLLPQAPLAEPEYIDQTPGHANNTTTISTTATHPNGRSS